MKSNKIAYILLATIVCIFTFSVMMLNNSANQTSITTSTSSLSNKKIGWGIKRNDNHEQPDLGSKNKELLEKYDGIAMGNKEEKIVYLTFDEGYEAGYTKQILEVLKNKNVKATFFITAHYVNTQPELVEQMIKENHIVRKSYCKT